MGERKTHVQMVAFLFTASANSVGKDVADELSTATVSHSKTESVTSSSYFFIQHRMSKKSKKGNSTHSSSYKTACENNKKSKMKRVLVSLHF